VTDASSLRPASGVRYAVDLVESGPARVVYRGAVHLPDASWPLEVVIEEGRAEARVEGPAPLQAHEKPAAALVKAAVKLPRPPEAGPPPRRIVRWRG
jgi:hypothetical protein